MKTRIAELRHAIAAADGREKIDRMNDLAYALGMIDVEESIGISRKAMKVAENVAYRRGQVTSMWLLSEALRHSDRNREALLQAREALALVRTLDDRELQARILSVLAILHETLGDKAGALEHYLLCLESYRAADCAEGVQYTYLNIGNFYFKTGDARKAREYYNHILQQGQDAEAALRSLALDGIGGVLTSLENRPREGLRFHRQSLRLAQSLKNSKVNLFMILSNIGTALVRLKNFEEARKQLFTALELCRRKGRDRDSIMCILHIGELYLRDRDEPDADELAECLGLLREALSMAQSMGFAQGEYRTRLLLARAHKLSGDFEQALAQHELGFRLQQEYNSRQAEISIRNLTILHELESIRSARDQAEKDKAQLELKKAELSEALAALQSLNKQLLRLDKEKSSLLDVVAHELKTPLAGINLVAGMLNDRLEELSPGALRSQLTVIAESSRSMLSALGSMLDARAIESGRRSFNRRPVDLVAILRKLVELYEVPALRKGIGFTSRYAVSEAFVLGDRLALTQVFDNPLSNAVKFSSGDAVVALELQRRDSCWRVEVRDSGPGLTADDRRRLFSRFTPLSASPSGSEESSGLGLWIAYELVTTLGGTIGCESRKGKGACFYVHFPIRHDLVHTAAAP